MSLQGMETLSAASVVDLPQGAGFGLEQPGQLGGGAAEVGGRRLRVHRVRFEDVEGLGDDGGEVVMAGADHDPAAAATRLPEQAGRLVAADGAADCQRQLDAE